MAGSEGGTTMLETPPYVIALVLLFFLVISLGFEKVVHLLRHSLQKRGKQGLLSAMTNMQNELMCLGLATLILLVFQSSITDYCISSKHYTRTWLDHVGGCSCCLTRTKGVSACYFAAKGCVTGNTLGECCETPGAAKPKVCDSVLDLSQEWTVPNTQGIYTVDTLTGNIAANTSGHARRLESLGMGRALLGGAGGSKAAAAAAEEVQCEGRVQTGWEECSYRPNARPAIGVTALHQVHIFIFITAIVHIAMGVCLIVAAGLRLRSWRRWRDDDDANVRMIQAAIDDHSKVIHSVAAAGKLESQGDALPMVLEEKSGSLARISHPSQLPGTFEIERRKPWRGRPEDLGGLRGHAVELAACFGRQFLPHAVTRAEFSVMRAAFVLTHHVCSGNGFRFLTYLRAAMEDDFSHVVGLGLPMWCFVIVFVLMSSAIGWCIWVFVILSGAMLAVLNVKLLWIARYVTRGGHVHRLEPGVFWLNRPWLMLPVIKFLLFFVSYVYANAIFFAAEFGPRSCFFSSVGFQGQPVPFWVILVVNTIFAASLSLLTLPLYSITVQMGGDFKSHLLPKNVVENALMVQSLQAPQSKGLRRMLSSWLPKERDAHAPFADERPIASLVNNELAAGDKTS